MTSATPGTNVISVLLGHLVANISRDHRFVLPVPQRAAGIQLSLQVGSQGRVTGSCWSPGGQGRVLILHSLSPLPGVTFSQVLTLSGACCTGCSLSPGPFSSHPRTLPSPAAWLARPVSLCRPQRLCHFCGEDLPEPSRQDDPFLDNLRAPSLQHFKQQ